LGQRLGLFTIEHEEGGSGFIYWLPKGAKVRQLVENHLRDTLEADGYQFVVTPHVARAQLWKTSGHLEYYHENMYPIMELENQDFILKPMNCPGHILIYKSNLHSYRELPLRIAEFGTVYRYERSGVLHGLLRVRGFTQDDAHIFCTPEQVEDEVGEILRTIVAILKTFGFKDYVVNLSTRPEKFSGKPESWTHAEGALRKALEKAGLEYDVDEGGGAFYGPKIDLKIKDSIGREWQCSTVQVDFNNPERFDINYRNEQGGQSQVFMIHRALLGSMERFFGMLIEHYAGLFPLWLAPLQAAVLTITEEQAGYAAAVAKKLKDAGLRTDLYDNNDKINAKVREAAMLKIPYLLVVGNKEAENNQVSVRRQDGTPLGVMSVDDFVAMARKEVDEKAPPPPPPPPAPPKAAPPAARA
jgi:threonyl-tRNA synthetase